MSEPHPTRRLVVGGLCLAGATPAGAAAAGRWRGCAPIPWAVQEVYGCAWRGQAAIAGGMSPDAAGGIRALGRVGFYSPDEDRWRVGPPLPSPRHHPALAAVGERLFAFGGFAVRDGSAWIATRDALECDGQGWRALPGMPRFQCETVAGTLDGRVHLVSGRAPIGAANGQWQDHGDVAAHQVFDPASGRWTDARPCPAPLNSATGAVIGGRLYLAGGRTVAGGNLARLDRYDPQRDAWEPLRPMPEPSGGLGGAVVGGKLYVFGGETPRSVIAKCWSYDPATDGWSAEPDMPTPRHGLAGVGLDGRVYAMGGAVGPSAGGASAMVEALIPG